MSGLGEKYLVKLMSGQEQLTVDNHSTGISLSEFWSWSVSDLVSNATRGRFAEFIVAKAIGLDISSPRDEWAPYDLISPEGIKIEVKSAAFLQSWEQVELSKIQFSIRTSKQWDDENRLYSNAVSRPSDVYVFCLLNHIDKKTLNPLSLDQWEFYVMNTKRLNSLFENRRTILLSKLQKHCQAIRYSELRDSIFHCFEG